MEQEIEITTQGQYKNIDLRKIKDGNFIVVVKDKFAQGKEVETKFVDDAGNKKKNYLCGVIYQETQVSFWLSRQDQHDGFAQAGGVGDKVKITAHKTIYNFTLKDGKEKEGVRTDYTFEVVQ